MIVFVKVPATEGTFNSMRYNVFATHNELIQKLVEKTSCLHSCHEFEHHKIHLIVFFPLLIIFIIIPTTTTNILTTTPTTTIITMLKMLQYAVQARSD